jgi:fructokinase
VRLLSIGEILWDQFDSDERLGGAPLNVAIHAARLGHDTAILSAVGLDARGSRALDLIRNSGVDARFIARTDRAPTGTASVVLDESGVPVFEIARPAAYDFPRVDAAQVDAVRSWQPDWIVFGTIAQATPAVLDLTERVIDACPRAGRLYDVNLRPGATADSLILSLLELATAVKAHEHEVVRLVAFSGLSSPTAGWPETVCRRLAEQFALRSVSVTRGDRGAALFLDGSYVEVQAPTVQIVDTVGAGDAFAAALLHGISSGWPASEVADLATRVGSLIAGRPGATPSWTIDEVRV